MDLLKSFIETKEKLPLLNYATHAMSLPAFADWAQVSRKKRLMTIVKRQPEVLAIVRGVATDITGYSHFEPINKKDTGRNKILAAEQFAARVGYQKLKRNTVLDALITGEGYNWLGKLSLKQQKEIKSMADRIKAKLFDEDLTAPRKMRIVASTTMSNRTDGYDITGYVQKVATQEIPFTPDEIIRLSFEELDGKVDGFTPLLSLPLHIELLWLLWQNQYYLQAKGNHPDLLLTVDGIDINHPSYKDVVQKLQSYNMPGNSTHGTLFLSGGKYTATVLDRVDTLQFKEVCQYVTSIIASMWQYPQGRMGVKTDQAAGDKDSSGMADKGYWSNIEVMQDLLANIYNSQLWEPYFGVREVYDKSYLHDEVVEGTSEQLRMGNLNLKLNVLARNGKTLTQTAMLNIINNQNHSITEDDLEEMKIDPMLTSTLPGSGSAPKSPGASPDVGKRQDELARERATGKPAGV